MFKVKKSQRKLRRYVEGSDYAIRPKADISSRPLPRPGARTGQDRRCGAGFGGDRNDIERAIQYYHAISRLRWSIAKATIRPWSPSPGMHEYGGAMLSEASLLRPAVGSYRKPVPGRSLPLCRSTRTSSRLGYDEPMLQAMYPDKISVRHQGDSDAVAPQPGAPEEARCSIVLEFLNDVRHQPRTVRGTSDRATILTDVDSS